MIMIKVLKKKKIGIAVISLLAYSNGFFEVSYNSNLLGTSLYFNNNIDNGIKVYNSTTQKTIDEKFLIKE